MKKNNEWLDDMLCGLSLCLIPLHIFSSFTNLANGIDKGYGHSYPVRSYVMIGIYLLVIAAVLAYMVCQRRFGIAKGWNIYWLSAGIALLVAALLGLFAPSFAENNLVVVAAIFYAPYMVLAPLLEMFGTETVLPLLLIVSTLCFLCWLICQVFVKKEK